MANQVPWNKIIIEEFVSKAGLTGLEEQIIRTRFAGWSITKQALTFNVSVSTINRIVKRLKRKYDDVQKYSVLLPPRKFSAKETWQDNH